MDKSDPINIIKKHYRALHKLITIVNKDFETEAIHQLRVEYKKLRAFLRMISEEKEKQEKIKIPRKVKKAYAVAGSIRDLQLQHKNMLAITGEHAKKIKPYLKLLDHQVRILQPQFRDIPLNKTIDKCTKETEELILEKINTIVAGRFINNNCIAITAIITSGNFSDVNMHTIRKHLKDIFYTMQKLENAGKGIKFHIIEILHPEKNYLDTLLEEFGNFQDKITSISLLGEHWLRSLGKANREILRRIKDTFIADHNAIKKALIERLEHEIVPHLEKLNNLNACTV